MKDTINSLDAVRVHERLIRADGDYYETFCGLSGYNMTLLLKQPGGASVANGFCQLYADGDTWMGAAWKVGPAKPADQDCSSSCEVNCYDGKQRKVTIETKNDRFLDSLLAHAKESSDEQIKGQGVGQTPGQTGTQDMYSTLTGKLDGRNDQ